MSFSPLSLAFSVAPRLPLRFVMRMADAGALIAARRGGAMIERLASNMARLTGVDPSDAQVRDAVRSHIRNYAEQLLLGSRRGEPLLEGVSFEGFEALAQASEDGPVVLALGHSGSWDRAGAWVCAHGRGIVTVGPVLAVQRDPVGLLQRERSLSTPQHIHIHPRTVRLGTVLHGVLRDIEGAVTQDLSSSDVAFHALREYVPGDDRRNVHWRTTARTGRLMVRQFEETRRSSLLVLLSTRQDDYAGEEDFETAVSIPCSLAMDAIQDGREVRFITQIGALPTSSALRMLDTSCLLSTGEDDYGCDLLVRHACTAHPDASIVVLVTGQQVDRAVLARARGFAPLPMVVVALRAGQDGLSRHHAGTMPVVDMDRLEQLPTALRRAL